MKKKFNYKGIKVKVGGIASEKSMNVIARDMQAKEKSFARKVKL